MATGYVFDIFCKLPIGLHISGRILLDKSRTKGAELRISNRLEMLVCRVAVATQTLYSNDRTRRASKIVYRARPNCWMWPLRNSILLLWIAPRKGRLFGHYDGYLVWCTRREGKFYQLNSYDERNLGQFGNASIFFVL